MKPKNRILYPFLLTLLVVAGLAALQALPPLTVEGYTLRPVSLLSDVIPAQEDTFQLPEPVDSVLLAKADTTDNTAMERIRVLMADSLGEALIEDYSFLMPDTVLGNRHGMAHFYEALAQSRSMNRPVRIAYFGDSFIEGDLMTADLRAKLQSAYGGSGVGFVDIDSPIAGFRVSVKSHSVNWHSHSATDTGGFKAAKQGIAERYFIPAGNSSVRLQGGAHSLHQDSCRESALFCRVDEPVTVTARINRGEPETFYLDASPDVQRVMVSGSIGQVEWSVPDSIDGQFFGATMDAGQGIILDNFALRGSSGTTLNAIPNSTLRDFAALREYDLIVFQFGLNVASNGVKDYSSYQEKMARVIRKFARAYPEASLLVVGMSDRGERKDGVVVTMPCVKYLNHYQRQLAMTTGCCYWNLFQAMGGDGSMGRMVEEDRPAKANMDYTHINAHGGRFVAGLLFDAIQKGKQMYEEGGVIE